MACVPETNLTLSINNTEIRVLDGRSGNVTDTNSGDRGPPTPNAVRTKENQPRSMTGKIQEISGERLFSHMEEPRFPTIPNTLLPSYLANRVRLQLHWSESESDAAWNRFLSCVFTLEQKQFRLKIRLQPIPERHRFHSNVITA